MVTDLHLQLATRLGALLRNGGWRLACAESCTGGGLAHAVTAVPGSSVWFDRGFVTYSNDAKRDMLGVDANILEAYGAVSEQVAVAMAAGALAHSNADIAVAVTGIAGPDGGSVAKPVGTVFVAWARRGGVTRATRVTLQGDRDAVRDQSIALALQGLTDRIESGA